MPPHFRSNPQLFVIQYCRRCCVVFLSLIAILYGVFITIEMIVHTTDRILICDKYNVFNIDNSNVNKKFDAQYANLYAWDQCNYKVYPLWSDDSNRYGNTPCQCRNLMMKDDQVAEWYNSGLVNTSQITVILESILTNYYMLETFWFDATDLIYTESLNLTDEMMSSKHLQTLRLGYVQFDTISENFGFKWNNLQYIKFDTILSNDINFNSWSNIKKLQYLSIETALLVPNGNSSWDFLCSLTNLRYIGITDSFDENLYMPDCIADDTKFNQLVWINTEYISEYIPSLLFMSQIIGLNAFHNYANISLFENQLHELNGNGTAHSSNEFELLEYVREKQVYFQQSDICKSYSNNVTLFNLKFPLTYQIIEATNACQDACSDDVGVLTCRPYWWHDGICQKACNREACGYDGGDCNQLCDFKQCNYTSLGDGICNVECNNYNCSFDFCDCFDFDNIDQASEFEIQQCGDNDYNQTLCEINTDCVVNGLNDTAESWVGDNFCDDYCNNEICNWDGGDCSTCDSSICVTFWTYFDSAANSEIEDYKVSIDEICSLWDTFSIVFPSTFDLNCSQFVVFYDQNNDTMLNGYETGYAFYLEVFDSGNQYKAQQTNCSLCAPTVSTYYL